MRLTKRNQSLDKDPAEKSLKTLKNSVDFTKSGVVRKFSPTKPQSRRDRSAKLTMNTKHQTDGYKNESD